MAACPQEQLNRIWRLFAAQGIGDDMQIIEGIAHHLLRHYGYRQEAERTEFPRPIRLDDDRHIQFEMLLDEALREHSPATLINECLFFRLDTMQAGGRYPTPRHIAGLMAELTQIFVAGEQANVADFACGSGGLLIEFWESNVTGIEIAPNWARLARANLILNRDSYENVTTGDVLAIFDIYAPRKFDIIALNPPFGSPLEAYQVARCLGPAVGTRSETVLALLALESLCPNGVLSVLQPGGALFSTSSGEVALRERLLNENQLEAIIQLPKDAFQPYSQLQTYLLLARKAPQSSLAADVPVWFYQIAHDGFSSGRNRQPQPERSQLPQLVAAVAAGQAANIWQVRNNDERVQIEIVPCGTYGYRVTQPSIGRLSVQCVAGGEQPALWITREAEETSHALLCAGQLWRQSTLPEALSTVAIQSLSFRLADESGQTVQIAQRDIDWQLNLKSTQPIAPDVTLATGSGFLGLFVSAAGELLSPLLLLPDVHKEYKPDPLSFLPLEDEAAEIAGNLLLWDSAAVKPLCFASASGEEGWILLAGKDAAALIGWRNGELFQALGGPLVRTFAGESWHRGVAVGADGLRFGVAVGPAYIRDERQWDLTFDRYYLPDEGEPVADRSAAEILAGLRQRQEQFTDRLDYLLGIVEMRSTPSLPSPLVKAAPLWPLNHNQRIVWQRIVEQTEVFDGGVTARLFRPEQLSTGLEVAEVQNALVLFEKMGLIVAVAVNRAPYYRRLTERDVVAL